MSEPYDVTRDHDRAIGLRRFVDRTGREWLEGEADPGVSASSGWEMKRYSIIYADPPWDYGARPPWCRGGANQHYATQSVDWIADLPVPAIAAWHSACFLWATFPKLPEALFVLRHWGFEYRTVAFTWVKLNQKSDTPFFGMGQWTRANAEICLLATRGTIARLDKSVSQVIESPPGDHSRKPDEARDRIVRLLGDLPRIELFARPHSPMWPKPEGWDVWGDEIASDIDMAAIAEGYHRPRPTLEAS